jgi:hypothetical protein
MPSTIVVSRRIYLPALIVASLLITILIGSSLVRAQGLCEYVLGVGVCIDDKTGEMRVVIDPTDPCTKHETPALLAHAFGVCSQVGDLERDIRDLENRITALEERLDACKACKPLP